jgi:uncharacterized membrane protein YhhN
VIYRLLADLVLVAHLLFIAFVAAGGLLAWKWPRLLWLHVPVAVWAAAIVTVAFTCPLTPLESTYASVQASRPTTAASSIVTSTVSYIPAGSRR